MHKMNHKENSPGSKTDFKEDQNGRPLIAADIRRLAAGETSLRGTVILRALWELPPLLSAAFRLEVRPSLRFIELGCLALSGSLGYALISGQRCSKAC